MNVAIALGKRGIKRAKKDDLLEKYYSKNNTCNDSGIEKIDSSILLYTVCCSCCESLGKETKNIEINWFRLRLSISCFME